MCGKKRHTKTEIRSEMSDLICGRIAAGENYNLTRDTEMYHMSVSKFMQMAKDAKAIYKLGQLVLVNLKIFDEYIETFHIVDDEFYK